MPISWRAATPSWRGSMSPATLPVCSTTLHKWARSPSVGHGEVGGTAGDPVRGLVGQQEVVSEIHHQATPRALR
jgi:hypothetical protein